MVLDPAVRQLRKVRENLGRAVGCSYRGASTNHSLISNAKAIT